MTWSEVTSTDLLHPGAGIEALLLDNGQLLMIYNDKEEGPRDKLAVSLSDDRGKTWRWTRHLENTREGGSIIPRSFRSEMGLSIPPTATIWKPSNTFVLTRLGSRKGTETGSRPEVEEQ